MNLARAGTELHPDRIQRDIDGGVFEVIDKVAPPPPAAPTPVASDAARLLLASLALVQQAFFAVLFALIVLEHADDGEGHAVDVEGFSDRVYFPANLLWCAPEFVARGRADDADVPGDLVIQRVEHAAMLDHVFIDLQRAGPHAHAIPGAEGLSVGRQRRRDAHLRGQERHQRGALLQRFHVIDGNADGLVGEVALLDRNALGHDRHPFQPANGHQRLSGAFLHAGDQGRHGHKAGNAKDNAQHRQYGAELVRPNFAHAGQDGDAKLRPGMA